MAPAERIEKIMINIYRNKIGSGLHLYIKERDKKNKKIDFPLESAHIYSSFANAKYAGLASVENVPLLKMYFTYFLSLREKCG